MLSRFRERSHELEHLDKGDYTAAEYEGCLAELRRVNRWLGDRRALRRTLLAEIERERLKEFSVLDVGAGSSELLRAVARWARTERKRARLFGLELNAAASRALLAESVEFEEIAGVRADARRLPFADDAFDYVFCSLFTHHLTDEEAAVVLAEMARVARRRIFVIDLHRHPIAYIFYITVGRIFLHNRLIREGGALSSLRSFVPRELGRVAERAALAEARVERRFPYRLVLSGRKRAAGEMTDV